MPERSAKLSLIFSCIGHFYVHLFTAFYFVIVLSLEQAWEVSYASLLELWTLGALMVGLAALPAGWLGDRWSASGMMVVFFIGLGGASIACGLVDGPSALLLGLVAIGLFAAIYHPVGIAWLVRNASGGRGKALGINGLFGAAGVAAAGLVAGALIDLFSWRAAFILPGLVSIATGIALWLCLYRGLIREGAAPPERDPPPQRSDMLRVFAVLVVTMTMIGLTFQATQASLPKLFDLRLRELVGEGALGIGALVALVYAVGGLMQVLGGHLADRYPLKPVYVAALLFQVPVLAAVALLGGPPLVLVAVLSVLLSTGALPAENMLLARYTPAHRRSLVYGAKYVIAFGIAPVAIWLAARVEARSGEFVWLYLGLALAGAIALVAALLLPGERRPALGRVQPAE